MGSGTLISRVLGLVRLTLIVGILGSSTRQGDMFLYANLIPNTLLLFLAGGVLNTVLVPQIVRAIRRDADGGESFVNRILTAFTLAMGGLTVLLTIGGPVLLRIYVSDAWRVPDLAEHYTNMLLLTYLCVPQLFFYGMFFLLSQVLNAKEQFGPATWAPIVNNVISIGVFGLYLLVWGVGDTSAPFTVAQMLLLGAGSTAGIIAQFIVLFPYIRKTGFTFAPRFDLRGAGLGRTAQLARWTIYYVVVSQLTLIIVQRLASSATPGGKGAGMTVYSSAEMLWLLPHSLITVSLATAMLSSASRLAEEGNLLGVAKETARTIKFAVLLLIPSAFCLGVFAYPLTRLLLGHGSGSNGAVYIGTTLICFAIGLVPYTIQFVCNRTYYAIEDTRGAFFLQLFIAVINAVLAVAFVVPFNAPERVAPALALSVSVSYLIGSVVTLRQLSVRIPGLPVAELVRFIVRLIVACIPGGIVAWFLSTWLISSLGGVAGDLVGGIVGGVSFIGLFVGAGRLLHIHELSNAFSLIRGRRLGSDPAGEDREDRGENPSVTDSIILSIPDEFIDTIERPAIMVRLDDKVAPIVESGRVLNHRYVLKDKILRRGDTDTWLAFDQVLSRLVLVHLLPKGSPRIQTVLDAARRGAVATEARFLRVLDAAEVPDPGHGIGAFVICEYAPGQNLEQLLANGPVSALEAAWIVREVADALASMHAQGLFHERLSPDTVLVTASGNIKIVGFGVEAALTPMAEGQMSWSQRGQSDVQALGKLLYACLVGRWPGGVAWGMPAAPVDPAGHYLTPRQVRQGVSPVLDSICDQILSERGGRGEPLRSAAEVADALSQVLGAADASGELEHRLRYPTAHDRSQPIPADQVPTGQIPVVMVETDEADFPPEPLMVQPPKNQVSLTQPTVQPRIWLRVLIGLVVAALVVSLAVMAFNGLRGSTPSAPATPKQSAAQPAVRPIASGRDFDPEGDRRENSSTVAQAFDGKADTGWTTERYRRTAKFGGLKQGVGIILDLGEKTSVSSVKVELGGNPSSMELRVPSGDEPSSDSADWRSVAQVTDGGTSIELKPGSPVETRYVLLWFTSVPAISGERYEGRINEVQVFG